MTAPFARIALGAWLTLLATACTPEAPSSAQTTPPTGAASGEAPANTDAASRQDGDPPTAPATAPGLPDDGGHDDSRHDDGGRDADGHHADGHAAQRASERTAIGDCTRAASRPEEAGYRVSECDGPAGYALRRVESDGRENLFVRTPGADFHSLRVSEHAGAGFGALDDHVEWRGTRDAGRFVPDALIAGYEIAEDPQRPTVKTTYLLPVRLAGPTPCITEVVGPGDDQLARARAIADDATRGCPPR